MKEAATKKLCDLIILVAAGKNKDQAEGIRVTREARLTGVSKSDVELYFRSKTDFTDDLIAVLLSKYQMLVMAEKLFSDTLS